MTKSKFKPKPGQVDYTNAHWAPVINCVVKFKDKILIVQRSPHLNFYPGYWNGISGFLDDNRTVKEKVSEELTKEVGINKTDITSICMGEIFHQEESKYNKIWIVHPVLVEVVTDRIILDWEANNYKWINIKEVKRFNFLPGFNTVLEKLFPHQLI